MRLSLAEQPFVGGLREPELGRSDNIMSQAAQVVCRGGIHILVEQKPHADTERKWMSSAATREMAYWMLARMSSTVSSG